MVIPKILVKGLQRGPKLNYFGLKGNFRGANNVRDHGKRETIMIGIVRMIAAGAVLVAIAGPAYAYQCPLLVIKIDKSLAAAANLSVARLEEIEQLRDDGEAKHKAGRHGDAVKTLNKALAQLEGKKGSTSGGTGSDSGY